LLEEQQRTIHRASGGTRRIKSRLAQYEPEIQRETSPAGGSSEKGTQYSLQAEEKRRRHRKRKKRSPGRRKTCLKFADAERGEEVYPEEGRRAECLLARERAVWRLENGRAVLVGYRIFRAPGGDEPPIPGVTPRCEYGIEIWWSWPSCVCDRRVAGQGLSDPAFLLSTSFGEVASRCLAATVGPALEGEFDALCDLLAHAAVVHMDETGWKIGKEGCSLWTFASELQRVFLFGCHKDNATLDEMLPPGVFQALGSAMMPPCIATASCGPKVLGAPAAKGDPPSVTVSPEESYQRFLDRLLELYYDAKRVAATGRLSRLGRQQR